MPLTLTRTLTLTLTLTYTNHNPNLSSGIVFLKAAAYIIVSDPLTVTAPLSLL